MNPIKQLLSLELSYLGASQRINSLQGLFRKKKKSKNKTPKQKNVCRFKFINTHFKVCISWAAGAFLWVRNSPKPTLDAAAAAPPHPRKASLTRGKSEKEWNTTSPKIPAVNWACSWCRGAGRHLQGSPGLLERSAQPGPASAWASRRSSVRVCSRDWGELRARRTQLGRPRSQTGVGTGQQKPFLARTTCKAVPHPSIVPADKPQVTNWTIPGKKGHR